MKLTLYVILLTLFLSFAQQVSKTDEIRITYTNGIEVFNVCQVNPIIVWDDDFEYYWYTEFSKIKSTKGIFLKTNIFN
jgi:hypothetical protein